MLPRAKWESLQKKKREEAARSEREREREREKPAGYCVSLQDPETKAPPSATPPPPSGKDLEGFLGGGGGGVRESRGWRMGLKYNPKGVTYFRGVSWPPALHL